MRWRSWWCAWALLGLAGPAAAGERQVPLNQQDAFKASFSEGIADAQRGNTYVVTIGDVEAGLLKLNVINRAMSFTPQVVVTGAGNKELLNKSAEGEGTDLSGLRVRVAGGRSYTVAVKDFYNTMLTTPYVLDMEVQPVRNPFAPNGDFATARPLQMGRETAITLFAPDGETCANFFKFTLAADGRVGVRVLATPEVAPQATLYDAQRQQIADAAANEGEALQKEAALAAGSYFIRVQDSREQCNPDPVRIMLWAR